jgi:geranylgeranyl pyrophosphate synthase
VPAARRSASGESTGRPQPPGVPAGLDPHLRRIEAALDRSLAPARTQPARFNTAIRYAVLGGGKRLRPLLAYAAAEWLGLAPERVDAIAVALEFVHAYSLVHDDLPAMDDDHLRRGRATTHLAFDEATAILVGDALQALAYNVLATDAHLRATPEIQLQLVRDLARASGSQGMAGGQAVDVAATGARLTAAELEDLYARKTGQLLHAAVIMPCRLKPDLEPAAFDAADRFARALGLAFQLADDLLDIEGSPEIIGKPQGSDARNRKLTMPSLLGIEGARRRLEELRREAVDSLAAAGRDAGPLLSICDWVVARDR